MVILYVSDTRYSFAYFTVKTKAYIVMISHTVQQWLLFKNAISFCLNSTVEQYIIAKLGTFFEPSGIKTEVSLLGNFSLGLKTTPWITYAEREPQVQCTAQCVTVTPRCSDPAVCSTSDACTLSKRPNALLLVSNMYMSTAYFTTIVSHVLQILQETKKTV